MIYIIGAGAIGKALAAFLTLSGKPATLIRGSVDDLPDSTETITLRLPGEVRLTAQVPVSTFSGVSHIDGPVLVASKAYANESLAMSLGTKNKDIPVVLLQNGLNVEKPFLDKGFSQLYRCVLLVTSQFAENGDILFKLVAPCPVGGVSGDFDEVPNLLDQLQNQWFPFLAEKDIRPRVWKKAITNCIFNSICPLLETDNGVFYRSNAALEIAERMIIECIGIASCCGIQLGLQDVKAMLLKISRQSEGQYISTLQDIRHKRPTEIGMLNQEIVRLAREFGMEHLVPQTHILGELIDIKSKLWSAKTFTQADE